MAVGRILRLRGHTATEKEATARIVEADSRLAESRHLSLLVHLVVNVLRAQSQTLAIAPAILYRYF